MKKMTKSKILLLSSLTVFLGVCILFFNFFLIIKNELYSDMKISMMDDNDYNTVLRSDESSLESESSNIQSNETKKQEKPKPIDYSKYYGVLEIPRIGLKRGFYNLDSRYNDISYNVTLVDGSQMPNVEHGNLILMAHSGDSYISYFAYLYRLNIGDNAAVTFGGIRYNYSLVNKYDVEKNGTVKIVRNFDKTTLTLITCTKDDDHHQTVYIFEKV